MKREIESVLFNEEKHEYWYTEGNVRKRLYGITGAIAKLLGKFFPENDACMLARMYGTDVHKEVENYFNNGNKELSTESGKWIVENINEFIKVNNIKVKDVKSELLISDFIGTASKIDIVITSLDGNAFLFDIKTGNFDRPYCSLQLSCYKYLFELCYDIKVCGLYVLHTKTKKRFHIIEQNKERVLKLLEMNKNQVALDLK